MEVFKEMANGTSACYIYIRIGGILQSSFWSAPPKSIDHVGLDYLHNRYPFIQTACQTDAFKNKYRRLFI
jgi:hypothetical protein